MLREEIKAIKSEKKDLRNFGVTIGIVLGLLAGILWWKEKDSYSFFSIGSLVFVFLGLIIPSVLRPLQKAWMTLAVIVGWFMTRVILSLLFYVVFTSIGMISNLAGKKFLDVDFKDGHDSYWIKKDSVSSDKSRYEKQF